MTNRKSHISGSASSIYEEGSNKSLLNRRKFIGGLSSAALALTIVPRHVLGGSGFIAPSDKITLAYCTSSKQSELFWIKNKRHFLLIQG